MISIEDLLGLGLSPRTAYLYARKLDQAIRLLEERHTDLMSCGPGDLAAIAEHFPLSHSARCQLRAALLAGWDLIERYNPPVRALRIPPKPRPRCKALSEKAAGQLEAYAFNHQDDIAALAVLIGLYAALRRAELAGLRWDDLADDETGRPAWWRVHGKGDVVAEVPIHPGGCSPAASPVRIVRRQRSGPGSAGWPARPVWCRYRPTCCVTRL